MKLWNTIAIFDCYIVAETSEKARDTLLALIVNGEKPSESVAVEAIREQSIRSAWRDQKPFVADDVSDKDFKQLQGKTTLAVFECFYTKRG